MNADDFGEWLMNRRKMLTMLGATGINMFAGYSSADSGDKGAIRKMFSCVVTPQQTEGPYFVDERLRRSDIRTDPSDGSIKDGLPLALEIRVSSINSVDRANCKPLAGAVVDIWHCDAQGIYSDVMDSSFNTVGKKFLRGYQVTDKDGTVRFITIYPGWYPGRTPHIHFKIRTNPKYERGVEFTSQLYFNDSTTDRVYAKHRAYARKGSRIQRTKNEEDSIFRNGGDQLVLTLTETDQGYTTVFDVGLSETPG